MTCPRCKIAMVEQKRVFHGQRKWLCPRCKRARFQQVKKGLTPPPTRPRR